jgi:hypothetical protein
MTENEAAAADQVADAIARGQLCAKGSPDCPGRNPQPDEGGRPAEPVFRRAPPAVYRRTEGGRPTVKRAYRCRFCHAEHVFPLD